MKWPSVEGRKSASLSAENERKPKVSFFVSAETEILPKLGILRLSAPKPKPKPNFGRSLLGSFTHHFERLRSQDLPERQYGLKASFRIPNAVIEALNRTIQLQITTKAIPSGTLWDLNVILYTAAVTELQHCNRLKERNFRPENRKPRWLTLSEEQINACRRKISFITCVLDCQKKNLFTNK